jgi:hypothetical protein
MSVPNREVTAKPEPGVIIEGRRLFPPAAVAFLRSHDGSFEPYFVIWIWIAIRTAEEKELATPWQ